MRPQHSNITCSIHQPNFLPWLGYFFKIAQSDIFIFLDDVHFSKGSYTSRVKMHKHCTGGEEYWISVPLQKNRLGTPINLVKSSEDLDWPKTLLSSFCKSYSGAPFYNETIAFLESKFMKIVPGSGLSEINEMLIKDICAYIGLNPSFLKSSDVDTSFEKENRLIDLALSVKADTYVSGMGGLKYLNKKSFDLNKIHLIYSDFTSHIRGRIPEDMINKSVVAYLFHYSIDEIKSFLVRTK